MIALTAWAGLILQFDQTLAEQGSLAAALWDLVRFFTVTTNLAAALIFTGIAINRPPFVGVRTLTGLTLSILLVGIVYSLMLQDQDSLQGYEVQASFLLHKVVPVMAAGYWLAFAPRGAILRHDPLIWSIYPIAYLLYALTRCSTGEAYPYPFIDPTEQGWSGVAISVAAIAVGFMLGGYALLWTDRRLAGWAAETMGPSFGTSFPSLRYMRLVKGARIRRTSAVRRIRPAHIG